ncbi:hypothetical protein [Streptomyces johnsoniae]|uniref:Abortive infection protein-like C-terminal domain-containing protein n=1 Tax=Streptomyces johnsoniae TaxID=3075532 RepID=A0ABU2SBY1_9ACTN|nr:hypothetical protein [Streptomyces sp. DSM 41886]MDT0445200.1 hypothetical protein [Streptomyces sp. DSM 41886]
MPTAESIARLREVLQLLKSFHEPADIRRAPALEPAVDKVVSAAAELVDVTEPENLQRLALAVKAIKAAQKAARAHRRNPLTRPLSHARFALKVGSAQGAIQGVVDKLDPADTRPSS